MCDVSQQRRRIASLLKWRHLESLPLASPYQRAPVHTGSSTRPSRTETPGGITLMHATLTRSPDVALERAPDTALPSPPLTRDSGHCQAVPTVTWVEQSSLVVRTSGQGQRSRDLRSPAFNTRRGQKVRRASPATDVTWRHAPTDVCFVQCLNRPT